MKSKPLEVKLITWPQNPLAALFYVWEQSRTDRPVPDPILIQRILDWNGEQDGELQTAVEALIPESERGVPFKLSALRTQQRLWDVITKIVTEDIPCTENLTFVFAFQNMSISLREQMVRHRIGVKIGDRTGIDIIPELASSTFWSSTSRVVKYENVYDSGGYLTPETIEEDPEALRIYEEFIRSSQDAYRKLIALGKPTEDARQVLPLAATHSITWGMNLKAMHHIMSKRNCFIAQQNMWTPLVSGVVNEMVDKVHPMFRNIALPPCFKGGKYNSCPYYQISRERVQGRDAMPPCPIWVYNQTGDALDAFIKSETETGKAATWSPPEQTPEDIRNWGSSSQLEKDMLARNMERFEHTWKLNVLTGAPL